MYKKIFAVALCVISASYSMQETKQDVNSDQLTEIININDLNQFAGQIIALKNYNLKKGYKIFGEESISFGYISDDITVYSFDYSFSQKPSPSATCELLRLLKSEEARGDGHDIKLKLPKRPLLVRPATRKEIEKIKYAIKYKKAAFEDHVGTQRSVDL